MLAIQIVCYYCWLLIKLCPVDLWWCGSPGGRIRQGLHSGDGTRFCKADFNCLFAPWAVRSQVSDYTSLESALHLLNEDLSPLITKVCSIPFPHLRNWKKGYFSLQDVAKHLLTAPYVWLLLLSRSRRFVRRMWHPSSMMHFFTWIWDKKKKLFPRATVAFLTSCILLPLG